MSGTTGKDGDKTNKPEEEEDFDIVDEEGEESFPASDPPSHSPLSGTKKGS